MANDNKKSLIKEIAIASCVLVLLLFIIIGGITWMNDGFDGTIMEQLFPAIFFGLIAAYCVLIILSNLLQDAKLWFIGAIVVFVATVVCWMLELKAILMYGAIVIVGLIFLLCLIRWIADLKK